MLTILDSLIKCVMVLLGLMLAALVYYFIHGSLELYPTEEQHDKVRTVSAFLIGIICLIELLLFSALRAISKRKQSAKLYR